MDKPLKHQRRLRLMFVCLCRHFKFLTRRHLSPDFFQNFILCITFINLLPKLEYGLCLMNANQGGHQNGHSLSISSCGHFKVFVTYSKPCLKRPLKKSKNWFSRPTIDLCRAKVLQNAILLTFIKLPFIVKIFVLSIFEWLLKTGFNVNDFKFHICVTLINLLNTGPRSAVGNVSGYRCVSDCRSRGREFDPGPVPYFCGD